MFSGVSACRAPVTGQQFIGYGIAFVGVCWYNYSKLTNTNKAALPIKSEQKEPLLGSK